MPPGIKLPEGIPPFYSFINMYLWIAIHLMSGARKPPLPEKKRSPESLDSGDLK